jgi:hypothetical protein
MTTTKASPESLTDINLVGEYAGCVWKYLSGRSDANAIQLKSALHLSSSQLFLAIGWLAREGKIRISKESGVYLFSLAHP